MKVLLSIETSGAHLGLSLFQLNGRLIRKVGGHYSLQQNKQSDVLVPVLDKLLKSKKIKKSQLAAVAVDIGPGSFTGVRVGVAVARILGQMLKCPVVGVSSLEAMAHCWFEKNPKKKIVAPVLPALKDEIYAGVFLREGEGLRASVQPQWTTTSKAQDFLKKSIQQTSKAPHPDHIAQVAWQRLSGGQNHSRFDYNAIEPLYLMPSWAERKK